MATSSTLHEVVWERLDEVASSSGIDVYDGEVPATPPLDPDGRVRAYAVLYASPGRLSASALDGGQRCLLASVQVTCVGGDPVRALGCVDAVREGLVGAVTVDGVARVIRAREESPGPVRTDPNVWPPRHYAPLEFDLFAP
jgi:hypothetical protein